MIDETHNGQQAVIDAATRAAGPSELELGSYYVLTSPSGSVHEIDTIAVEDRYLEVPRRAKGCAQLGTVESFAAYVKHLGAGAEFPTYLESLQGVDEFLEDLERGLPPHRQLTRGDHGRRAMHHLELVPAVHGAECTNRRSLCRPGLVRGEGPSPTGP